MEFSKFINRYKTKLNQLFNEEDDIDEISLSRGLPHDIFQEVMECQPLSVFIPEEYGGRGGHTYEALSMLEASSYQSLPLSLMMGINGALFLQPVVNYGSEEVKQPIFDRFLKEKNMGGLMITEPDFGSDALRMETSFEKMTEENSNTYKIQGTKHWAGLTGAADFWLITARRKSGKGKLGRDIGFFIHDSKRGGIEVEEYYKNLGLYMLPYGRNKININVPEEYRLNPRSTGIKMMLDVLHRSRLQFPGMGNGFLKRMMVEGITHCKQRSVGGQSLFNYDQVKKRLNKLQSSFTICSAMCAFTSNNVPIHKDVSGMDIAANAIKTYTTDLMQQAAQSLLQLTGAKGYRLDHIAGRALIDSRPFQIFEGSNDILYQQISESVLKRMRRLKLKNLSNFLSDFTLTERASDYFSEMLDFKIDQKLAQDRLVELGRILSRVISLEFTLRLSDKGFNQKMIENTIQTLQAEVEQMVTSFISKNTPDVVEDYEESSSWLEFMTPKYAGS
ncbi:acyl-CoA dehydrogenase family protein [Fodinibius salsisoli]|uniref:Acyl-CoA/acyl-ACP dehydrogenase n=1 Tax=Fodinibius salsisoli TaxID=2820877 RepID=A0ABT3PLV7_9BACT|nr:acyl-CoA dehydrogenase family protein [Fodinibius salsisoli]MCW9706164.1 acyl-CoA/acyl-ACP dehydrogenase [Fodinibius salsisoli]